MCIIKSYVEGRLIAIVSGAIVAETEITSIFVQCVGEA